MRSINACLTLATIALMTAAGCDSPPSAWKEMEAKIGVINDDYVFVDVHSHVSRFHRENVEAIAVEEIEIYRSNHFDLVVANISSDMVYFGGYTNRDGTVIEHGKYKPEPGEPFRLAADRQGFSAIKI